MPKNDEPGMAGFAAAHRERKKASKMTPGPWRVVRIDGFYEVWGSYEGTDYIVARVFSGEGNNRGANARAIAAVPDLIYTLREILAELNEDHPDPLAGKDRAADLARAALRAAGAR